MNVVIVTDENAFRATGCSSKQEPCEGYYCRESEPNSCKSRALSLPVFQYNGHTWPSGDQPAGKVNQIPVKTVHFPGTKHRRSHFGTVAPSNAVSC